MTNAGPADLTLLSGSLHCMKRIQSCVQITKRFHLLFNNRSMTKYHTQLAAAAVSGEAILKSIDLKLFIICVYCIVLNSTCYSCSCSKSQQSSRLIVPKKKKKLWPNRYSHVANSARTCNTSQKSCG